MSFDVYPSLKTLFSGEIALETTVQIKGWLRSRRTSKGGFSFLQVHDGSCFDAIQIVADEKLANYPQITELNTGCAVAVSGKLVAVSYTHLTLPTILLV